MTEFEIKSKLTQLEEDFEVLIKFSNEDQKIPHNLICEAKFVLDVVYLKQEIEIFKENVLFDPKQNTLSIKFENCKLLNEIESNNLLNVSLFEIHLYNKSENFEIVKKMVVQFLKEKGVIYKNIIV